MSRCWARRHRFRRGCRGDRARAGHGRGRDRGRRSRSGSLEDIHMTSRKPPCRADRAGGRAAAHRAQPQRPGGDRLPALGARCDRPARRRARRAAAALVANGAPSMPPFMPGFTHLQTAQPVTLGHHLMAYYEMAGATARASPTRVRGRPVPAGRGGAGRHGLSDRPRDDRAGAGLRRRPPTASIRCPTAISRSIT